MRPEDTELASGEPQFTPPPVHMDLRCELIDAPRDIKALWAIEQVIQNLNLTPDQIMYVLKFLRKRHELPF